MRSSLVASDVAWNRAKLRRGAVGEIEPYLVDVAPSPSFWRIVAFNDWVSGRMKMLGGVAIRGVVATTYMPAGAAEPQMHPNRSRFQAFLAAACARRHVANGVFVRACSRRQVLPGLRIATGGFSATARDACSVARR